MSPIFIAVFTILFALSDCFPSKETELMAKMVPFHKECAERASLPMEEISKRGMGPALTENMMCFDKCLFEKNGILADGQFKMDLVLEAFDSPGQPEKTEFIKSTVTKCNLPGAGQNTCTSVGAMMKCWFTEMAPKP